MPPKQPKKGKGKKVTVTDPMSAPAAPPNSEVQPVLDAHIANVGSVHFPTGSFPIPHTLTHPDAESFPQLPPLREPLEAALFGKWDRPGNPDLVRRIDATRVNFALTRGVLSRFCCPVMGRYPTTLAVELKLSQVTLEAFNKTLKLCTAAASKEFVNVLDLQEKPPKGLDPEEQWLWVDPVKKSGWTHRTATDAVVRYQTVKVQGWDAVAPTEFSTNRRLRTHVPNIRFPDPPPRFCTVSETVSAVHGRVHPPHDLPPIQVPPGVPGHAGGLSRCELVGYCYPTASQRDAPPRDGDPPRCGRAWLGTVHPVCTRRLPVPHADRGAGECNGADELCSGDALRASGRGGCIRVSSGHRGQFELQPP